MLPNLEGDVLIIATRNAGKVREFAHRFGKLGLKVRSLADYAELPDIVEDRDTFAGNAEKKAVVIAQALGLPVLADDSGLCVDALDGAPGVYSARYAGEPADDAANNRKLLAELGRLRLAPLAAATSIAREEERRAGAANAANAASEASASVTREAERAGRGGEAPEASSAKGMPAEAGVPLAAQALAAAGVHALSEARFVCALAVHDPATGATLHAEGACEGWIIDRTLGDNGFGYDPLFFVPAFGRTMAQLSMDEKNAISHRAIAIDRMLEKWR
jgi:XTP/dITP diphosphohydrolase